MTKIDEIYNICNGIEYTREVPKEAVELAKKEGYVIIVGGSDDLMYCYGAKCYLTDTLEHSYGYDGNTLTDISDIQLKLEAEQLGLEIYWCGKIFERIKYPETWDYSKEQNVIKELKGYDVEKQGGFSYKVKEGIEYKDFTVYENLEKGNEVYCTGIIFKLPDDFCKEGDKK